MLSENIKTRRKAKGLSQEELALRLHVVRQTISKWEQGLSVPDADLLLALSQALDTPVSDLLGETLPQPEAPDLQELSQRLEAINLQLARGKAARRKGGAPGLSHSVFPFSAGVRPPGGPGRQPGPQLGLQRPRDRRGGDHPPRGAVGVCPGLPLPLRRLRPGRVPHQAEELSP